ncbi:ATP-binding protein [Sandaracinomonas limnophila]|uniref:ATP-binding protein n=1 Tax=Sandaracinomonas limnophila TaxID=1862386 RepID=A0A437PPC5_9BACT|nr:ATP-binding protein [Sandaracinomonas limnophila]RVU24125.1 ATP-binding protein [Sandaracinomonas limnophila]
MKTILRQSYLETLSLLKDKNLIKVATGVRRCGKSTLFTQFQNQLRNDDPTISIISINLDMPNFRNLAEKNWKEIYDFIIHQAKENQVNYVFIDEVQNVKEFEKLLEGLFVTPNIDLYVTGSNAFLLSSELATLLTGRAFEIHVLPFSFKEFLSYTGKEANPDRAFAEYIRIGGFPEAIRLSEVGGNFVAEYLQTVYRNIFENDISKRYTIYAENSYYEVVNFLIDSIGSSISSSNISNKLTSNNKKIDNKTVSKYISTLVEAYLFYRVNRFDIKGKQHLATQEKYYLVDLGFRSALIGKELSTDSGHLLENVIYLELKRRNYQVWIGKTDGLEVDFVVRTKDGYTKYIQVSQTVQNELTLERELKPFNRISDHNEKILLTMDYDTGTYNGVKKVNAIDWLLSPDN